MMRELENKTKNNNTALLGLGISGFCYFAALGYVLPFVPILLRTSNLTYAEIGLVYMAGLFLSVLVQTLWGTLADRVGRKILVILATVASAVVATVYPHASTFTQFLLLGLSWFTFQAAATTVTPLIAVGASEPVTIARRFGKYRVSGSAGWIASTATSGLVSESLGVQTIFYLAAILLILSAVSIQISIKDQAVVKSEATAKGKLHSLVVNRNFLIFLVTILMANISATTFVSFLSLYISQLGGSASMIGWAFSIAAITEIPCMIYLGGLSDRIGRKPLLIAALLFYPLRLFLYTMASTSNLILPIQLLHGMTFGVLYVASVAFVSDITSESRGTAMGMYNTASSAGSAAGSALAGFIADSRGLIDMYRFMAAFSIIPVLIFAFMAKETLRVQYSSHTQKPTGKT